MIDDYKAAGWSQYHIRIIQDPDLLQQFKEQLDLKDITSVYVLTSDTVRAKLLSGEDIEFKTRKVYKSKAQLWKNGVYQQDKNNQIKNYKVMAYKSLVGSLRKWLDAPYITQKDAAVILDPNHYFEDGEQRPYPIKLAGIKVKNTQDYVIATHTAITTLLEGNELPPFQPIIPNDQESEYLMKLYFWANPSEATKLAQMKKVHFYKQKYAKSIIRENNIPIPSNDTAGLDRITESSTIHQLPDSRLVIGFIENSEIPVLVEEK